MALTDIIRWIAIIGGAVVLGLHLAVYRNAGRITYHPMPWRIFIAGNSILTAYALLSLYAERDGNTVYIVFAAMALTLLGIVALDHSYRTRKEREAKRVERMEQRTTR